MYLLGVEDRIDAGDYHPTNSKQTPNTNKVQPGSQAAGDKFRSREGKSPDRQLRSPNMAQWKKEVDLLRQPGCWLRSSHHLKSA